MAKRNGKRYQQVCTSIWDDDKFRAMDDDTRQVFLYLLTCKHSNLTGLFIMPLAYMANDIGWKPLARGLERAVQGLDNLRKLGRIDYDDATETVLMVNHLKHRPLDCENRVSGALAALGEIPQSRLFSRLLEIIEKNEDRKISALMEPLARGLRTLGHTVTVTVPVTVTVTEPPKPDGKASPADDVHDEESRRLGELLLQLIRQRDEKAKEPNWKNWDANIGRLIKIDGRTAREIETVIRWCQADGFWHKNILSAETLRRQFAKLLLNVKGGNHGTGGKNGGARDGWSARENADQVRGLKPNAVVQSGGDKKPE